MKVNSLKVKIQQLRTQKARQKQHSHSSTFQYVQFVIVYFKQFFNYYL